MAGRGPDGLWWSGAEVGSYGIILLPIEEGMLAGMGHAGRSSRGWPDMVGGPSCCV